MSWVLKTRIWRLSWRLTVGGDSELPPPHPPPILSLSPTDTGRWSGRSGVTCFRSSSDHHLIFVRSPFNHHRLIIIIASSYKRHAILCSSDLVLIIDTMHHQREVRSHFLQIFISFPIFIQSYLVIIKINMVHPIPTPQWSSTWFKQKRKETLFSAQADLIVRLHISGLSQCRQAENVISG